VRQQELHLTPRLRARKTAEVKTVLAIAGCGPRLEVALAAPQLPAPALVALAGPTPRSDLIVAAIDLLLRSAGIPVEALEAVVATRGPGSFTGIRVALATAQGLAAARGIPGHGVSSLLVQSVRTAQRPCIAVQPARRGFVYAQRFEKDTGGAVPMHPAAVVAIESLAAADAAVVAPAGLALPAGTPLAAATLTAAEALLELAARLGTLDAATLTPTYIESPQAVPPGPPTTPWQPSRKAS
jgi:tRNA threonylcarbamoyl adenosine modification protein YeaZ